jgi:hypothetical protein
VHHEIYFFKELPKGISGKIQVEQLKKIILENRRNHLIWRGYIRDHNSNSSFNL